MKTSVNTFAITAFVATEPQVKNLTNTAVARFAISISRKEGENRVSALQNVESYRKLSADNVNFADVAKGKLLTFKGYFKPENWTDKDGNKRERIVLVATSIEVPEDKPE